MLGRIDRVQGVVGARVGLHPPIAAAEGGEVCGHPEDELGLE